MRNRRIFKILPSSAVGLLLISLAPSAASTLRGESEEASTEITESATAPLPGSFDESRLETQARLASADAVADRDGRQRLAERAARQRAATERANQQRIARQRAAHQRAAHQRAARNATRPRPLVLGGDDIWAKLRRCESGGDYRKNTGNGFYGAYQFLPSTWRSLGYKGLPHQAPPEVQDEAARKLQKRSGWGQWPSCSRRIGARR